MQTRALFLILWDKNTEESDISKIQNEAGKIRDYKNYKLDYWLHYVRVLGKGSRALIIQSKEARDGKKNPRQELMVAYKDIWIDNLSIDSAIDDPDLNGFENLKTAIKKTIKATDLLGKEQLPNNWIVSRGEFHKLLNKGIKTISYEEFGKMCKGKVLVNSDTLLYWLVDSGVVFYKEGLFNNQIIIDQQWAINAVYTLFDRKKHYYQLKDQKGKFTKQDLKEFWEMYSLTEQELFLSYMLSCEICYEVDNVYIAPALLPEDKPAILDSFWEGRESYFVKYEMLFFHYGTMQSFLVRLGNMQLDVLLLWQYGISFRYKEKTLALVEAKPDDKQIIVSVSGQDTKSLLDKIRNLLEEIQGKEGITESFSIDGKIFFDESDKEKYSEMKKFFEKDDKDKFEKERRREFQEIKDTLQGIKQKQDEYITISKGNSVVLKDTFAAVDLLLDEVGNFKNEFSNIKQTFSSRKKDDETRINQLTDLIDNHKVLLEEDKDQRLADAKEKGKKEFPKFSSLQTDSQTFIAMGFYFLDILPDNGDFSPAALQFCRALELEMKVVFKSFKNSCLTTYPSHNNSTHTNFQKFIKEPVDNITLAQMVHVIESSSTTSNHQLFIDFKKFLDNQKPNIVLNHFLIEVQIFKDGQTSPRNKSAHTSRLSKADVEDCKEKVLCALEFWL